MTEIDIKMLKKIILNLPENIAKQLAGEPFNALMQMPGKAFRDVRGRKTIQIKLGNKSYFIKQHFGVGWAEIFKNLIAFKNQFLAP